MSAGSDCRPQNSEKHISCLLKPLLSSTDFESIFLMWREDFLCITNIQAYLSVAFLEIMVDLIYRAGKKLEAALDHFKIDVKGLNILDSGISTGGFSDCLLQRGAASLVGVDVGYGQVALCLQLAYQLIVKLC